MAHARRYFIDAMQDDAPLADHALKMFQQLYAIEAHTKNLELMGEDKLRLPKEEAVPILKAMKQWLTEEYVKLRPTSPIAKKYGILSAPYGQVNYLHYRCPPAYRQQSCGKCYTPHYDRSQKSILFAGSHEAAQHATMMYSFFNTCQLYNIKPYEWLKDVLERMHLYTSSNLHELLPQKWVK